MARESKHLFSRMAKLSKAKKQVLPKTLWYKINVPSGLGVEHQPHKCESDGKYSTFLFGDMFGPHLPMQTLLETTPWFWTIPPKKKTNTAIKKFMISILPRHQLTREQQQHLATATEWSVSGCYHYRCSEAQWTPELQDWFGGSNLGAYWGLVVVVKPPDV